MEILDKYGLMVALVVTSTAFFASVNLVCKILFPPNYAAGIVVAVFLAATILDGAAALPLLEQHRQAIASGLSVFLSVFIVSVEFFKKKHVESKHLWAISCIMQLLFIAFSMISGYYGFLIANVFLSFISLKNFFESK